MECFGEAPAPSRSHRGCRPFVQRGKWARPAEQLWGQFLVWQLCVSGFLPELPLNADFSRFPFFEEVLFAEKKLDLVVGC